MLKALSTQQGLALGPILFYATLHSVNSVLKRWMHHMSAPDHPLATKILESGSKIARGGQSQGGSNGILGLQQIAPSVEWNGLG